MPDATQPKFSFIGTNGIKLHVAEAGPADGPLLILLHGFPEFWYGWRHQIGPLAAAGYHVVVPDQRGYNLSDKPRGAASYRLDSLAGDIIGLADHFGAEKFFLAGHDWGAIAGWWLATKHPGRLHKFVALSAGHPAPWIEQMKRDPVQRRLSWYVRVFQWPMLPEMTLRARNFRAMAAAVSDTARGNDLTADDLKRYRAAWGQTGELTATINWYRAIWRWQPDHPSRYRVTVPTLVIWGGRDKYGTQALIDASVAMCDDGRAVFLENATHWVLTDEAARVITLLREFFGR